jgi:hypothetical protein
MAKLVISGVVMVQKLPDLGEKLEPWETTMLSTRFEAQFPEDGSEPIITIDGDNNKPEHVSHALSPLLVIVKSLYPDQIVQDED